MGCKVTKRMLALRKELKAKNFTEEEIESSLNKFAKHKHGSKIIDEPIIVEKSDPTTIPTNTIEDISIELDESIDYNKSYYEVSSTKDKDYNTEEIGKSVKEADVLLNENTEELDKKGSSFRNEFTEETLIEKGEVKSSDFNGKLDELFTEDIENLNSGNFGASEAIATDGYYKQISGIMSLIQNMFENNVENYSMKMEQHYKENGESYGMSYKNLHHNKSDKISIMNVLGSRMATKSEIMTHETIHLALKGVLKNSPKIKYRADRTKERFINALDKIDIDKYILFTIGIEDITDAEIKEAKDKAEYIFGEDSDVEEFMAYVMSNASLYNALNTLEESIDLSKNDNDTRKGLDEKSSSIITNIMNDIISLYRDIKVIVKDIIYGFDNSSNNVTNEINSIFIEALDVRSKFENNMGGSSYGEDGFLLNIAAKEIMRVPTVPHIARFGKVSFDKTKKQYEKILGHEMTERNAKRMLNQYKKIRKNIRKSNTIHGAINALESVGVIRNIVKSEMMQSIYDRLVRTEEHGNGSVGKKNSAIMKMITMTKKAESEAMTMRDSIVKTMVKNDIGSPAKAHEIGKLLIHTGIYKIVSKLEVSDMKKQNIIDEKDRMKDILINSLYTEDEIKHLDAIADFAQTRKVSIKNQQINVVNVLLGLYKNKGESRRLQISDRDISVANDYVSLKILSNMKNKDFKSVRELIKDKHVLELINNYSRTEKDYLIAIDDSSSNSVAYGFNKKIRPRTGHLPSNFPFSRHIAPSTHSVRAIKFGTIDEASAIGSSIISNIPVMYISGKPIYRYTTKNYSANESPGAIGSIRMEIEGYSLSTVISKEVTRSMSRNNGESNDMFAERKKIAVQEAMDNFVNKHEKSGSKKNKNIIATYNEYGRVKDLIMPFTKDDIYNQAETSISPIEFISGSMFEMKYKTQKHYSNIRILDSLMAGSDKHKFHKNSSETKDKLISLRDIPGLKLDERYRFYSDVMIPKHMILEIAGAKRSSLVNGMEVSRKLIENIVGDEVKLFGSAESWNNVAGMLEKMVEEIMSKKKELMTLFTPAVLIGNAASNMHYLAENGIAPSKYISEYYRMSANELPEFFGLVHKKSDIKALIESSLDNDEIENLRREFGVVSTRINNSRFGLLYNSGQMDAILEDLDSNSKTVMFSKANNKFYNEENYDKLFQIEVSNELAKLESSILDLSPSESIIIAESNARDNMDKKIKVNGIASKVFSNVYGESGSWIHDKAQKALVYGDIISKVLYIENQQKKYGEKFKSKKTLSQARDMFINYDTPQSSIEQWLEKVGGLFYTKYLLSVMKGYIKSAKRNKERTTFFHVAELVTGIQAASPDDAVTKNGPIDAIINRFQGDQVIEHAESIAIAPPLLNQIFDVGISPAYGKL